MLRGAHACRLPTATRGQQSLIRVTLRFGVLNTPSTPRVHKQRAEGGASERGCHALGARLNSVSSSRWPHQSPRSTRAAGASWGGLCHSSRSRPALSEIWHSHKCSKFATKAKSRVEQAMEQGTDSGTGQNKGTVPKLGLRTKFGDSPFVLPKTPAVTTRA